MNLSFRDIYIFYEKRLKEHLKKTTKNMFIDVIQTQAFELLVFTRMKSKTSLPILRVVIFASKRFGRGYSGESCQLGC